MVWQKSLSCSEGQMEKVTKRVASMLLSGEAKSVVVLTGAGVSTGAVSTVCIAPITHQHFFEHAEKSLEQRGIPDFRSPGGMYATLKPDLITATEAQRALMRADPQCVVERSMFFANQFPYLEVRRPFILGTRKQQWKATISHWFFKFLDEDGKLLRLFTQNIDGLDYQTGIDRAKAVNVHGSLAEIACEACDAPADFDEFCDEVSTKIKDIYGVDPTAPPESRNLYCQACGEPTVKPNTVMFGGSLPSAFFEHAESDAPKADLLLVAGTSLLVSPANSLVDRVARSTPRVVVNRERVGRHLGLRYGDDGGGRDMFAEGDCDVVFLDIMAHLGWLDRLAAVRDRLPEGNRTLLDAALAQRASSDM